MLPVLKTDEANNDLWEIWDYIADENETEADRWVDRINERFLYIAEYPEIGRDRTELLKGMRSYTVGNYIIFLSD